MKKTLYLLATLFLLNGCVESLALLGTATSVSSGGNIAQSAISSAASYGVKKKNWYDTITACLSLCERA